MKKIFLILILFLIFKINAASYEELNPAQNTELHQAIYDRKSVVEIEEILSRNSENLDVSSFLGNITFGLELTPLQIAALTGNIELTNLLISSEADITTLVPIISTCGGTYITIEYRPLLERIQNIINRLETWGKNKVYFHKAPILKHPRLTEILHEIGNDANQTPNHLKQEIEQIINCYKQIAELIKNI